MPRGKPKVPPPPKPTTPLKRPEQSERMKAWWSDPKNYAKLHAKQLASVRRTLPPSSWKNARIPDET